MPVVNENDATSDDEIRFGDNDRLAALVAHLVSADMLVLLTDTPGLLSADPRLGTEASLIEEVVEIDHELERVAGGSGGSRRERRHGVQARCGEDGDVVGGTGRDRRRIAARSGPVGCRRASPGVGTVFRPMPRRLPARKLWIAFAVGAAGTVTVDDGARAALVEREASLLPAGVLGVKGRFYADDAVEIAGPGREGVRQGPRPPRFGSGRLVGGPPLERNFPEGVAPELVHRDDLVVIA